jgi:hypothetical protein
VAIDNPEKKVVLKVLDYSEAVVVPMLSMV